MFAGTFLWTACGSLNTAGHEERGLGDACNDGNHVAKQSDKPAGNARKIPTPGTSTVAHFHEHKKTTFTDGLVIGFTWHRVSQQNICVHVLPQKP